MRRLWLRGPIDTFFCNDSSICFGTRLHYDQPMAAAITGCARRKDAW